MPAPRSDPHWPDSPDFEELLDTTPRRPREEIMADALTQMGERLPAGYREHQAMQYRGHYPDVSELLDGMGLA